MRSVRDTLYAPLFRVRTDETIRIVEHPEIQLAKGLTLSYYKDEGGLLFVVESLDPVEGYEEEYKSCIHDVWLTDEQGRAIIQWLSRMLP